MAINWEEISGNENLRKEIAKDSPMNWEGFGVSAPRNTKLSQDEDERIKQDLPELEVMNPAAMEAFGMNPFYDPEAKHFKTGIKLEGDWGKQFSAGLVGTGHLMGDMFRGLAQISNGAGLDMIDEAQQNNNERHMQKLYASEKYGTAAFTGSMVGAVAEPAGFLIPMSKGKTLYQVAKQGVVVGGTYGAASYTTPEESRLMNTAIGMTAGGTLSPLMVAAGRQLIGKNSWQITKAANKALDDLDLVNANLRKEGLKKGPALEAAMAKQGLTDQHVTDLVVQSGRADFKVTKWEEAIENYELMASRKGPMLKMLEKVGLTHEKMDVKAGMSSLFEPITDALGNISIKLKSAVRGGDAEQHIMTARRLNKGHKEFSEVYGKLTDLGKMKVTASLYSGNWNDAIKVFNKEVGVGSANSALKNVKATLKEIHVDLKKTGYTDIKTLKDYFPRLVKDHELLDIKQSNYIQKALDKAAGKYGTLSPTRKAEIIQQVIERDPKFAAVSGAHKHRKYMKVDSKILPAYHEAPVALEYYIRSNTEDIARRNVFKSLGVISKKSLAIDGSDIDSDINAMNKLFIAEGLSSQQANKAKDLLMARYVNSRKSSTYVFQAMKDISYATTLGNWWSAMTQLGDLIVPMHRYGILNAAQSVVGKKLVTKELMGLEHATADLATDGVLKSITNWSLKLGMFNRMDKFGKEVHMNSATRFYQKMLSKGVKGDAKFRKKWGKVFEDETDDLIKEIKGFDVKGDKLPSDRMLTLLWNELAEVQPISISEMPKMYLNHPNGRIWYTYKSFILKQMNYIKNIIREDPNKVRGATNAAYFISLFVAGNTSVDVAKDLLSGEDDIKIENHAVDNLAAFWGGSRYTMDRYKTGTAVKEGFFPVPAKQAVEFMNDLDSFVHGDTEDLTKTLIENVPVVGTAAKKWGATE